MSFRRASVIPVKTVIQELEGDIQRIDEGIQILQRKKRLRNPWPLRHILKEPLFHGATLDRLLEERRLLVNALYSHTTSGFVLQQFPFEVWELIFQYCTPSYYSSDPFYQLDAPSVKQAPLSLSHVNKEWRAWVLNMPTLWTRLVIRSSRHAGRMGFALEMVKEWLARANQRPLTLSIKITEEKQREAGECGLMDFLWGLSGRWQHLRLEIDSAEAVFKILYRPMPLLRTLDLPQWTMVAWTPQLTGDRAPLLSDFRSGSMVQDPIQLELLWDNLTHLSSSFLGSVQEIIDLLKLCPNLRSCSLNIFKADGSFDGGPLLLTQRLCLPFLTSLALSSTSSEQIGRVLDQLDLPELHQLYLYGEVDVANYQPAEWVWPKGHVYGLAQRQVVINQRPMKLRKLVLKGTLGYNFGMGDIQEIRLKIPSLRLVDVRDGVPKVGGTGYSQHLYLPKAEEGVENWHGLRVVS